MKLKKWLKNVDLWWGEIKIFIGKDEVFNGDLIDIPWHYIEMKIEEICFNAKVNEYGTAIPIIVVSLIEDEEV